MRPCLLLPCCAAIIVVCAVGMNARADTSAVEIIERDGFRSYRLSSGPLKGKIRWAFDTPGDDSPCAGLLARELREASTLVFASYRPTHPAVVALLNDRKTLGGFYDANYCTDCVFTNPAVRPVRLGRYAMSGKRPWFVMHHKFAVLNPGESGDGAGGIITGSFNWNLKASRFNYEDLVCVDNPVIARAFYREFVRIGSKDTGDQGITVDGPVRCAFNASCAELLLRYIRGAKHSIWTAIYAMNPSTVSRPNPVWDGLVAAAQRGVDVRVIINAEGAEGKEYAGIKIIRARLPKGDMHHKFTVIDGRVVSTGSFNYLYKAMKGNYENLVVIEDKAVAASYAGHWEALYKRFR